MTRTTIAGLARMVTEEIKPLLSEHDKILVRGNGEPSLQEKLRNIEAYIREDRENRRYYSRLFIGIAASNILAIIFAAIVWFVKIIPILDGLSAQNTGL